MTVNPEQVQEMGEYAHIYMTKDGRISMAGLNEHNIQVSLFLIRHQLHLTSSTSPRACRRLPRES
jgi:hypothetical protein